MSAKELYAEVGDGLAGRRRRIVGVSEPSLLQQRSDTPCPMLTSSSCFNQGRLLTRSLRCCATERAPCWRNLGMSQIGGVARQYRPDQPSCSCLPLQHHGVMWLSKPLPIRCRSAISELGIAFA